MTKNEFYTKWLETFASGISKREIKKYVQSTGNYLWHVFSWELLKEGSYLAGDAARKAYDRADKQGASYIEWFADDHTKDMIWDLQSAKALDALVEIYIVGKDFRWTYIKTHEGSIGPYFLELN